MIAFRARGSSRPPSSQHRSPRLRLRPGLEMGGTAALSAVLVVAWAAHLAAARGLEVASALATADPDADATPITGAVSGDTDAKAILQRSANTTSSLRHTMARLLQKSTEEMKSLKSLLTTNAKATKAMNEMLLEMDRLASRMGKFTGSMEKCRQQLLELEARDAAIMTPQEANDPLLGPTLLQLHRHLEKLRWNLRGASHALLTQPRALTGFGPY
mmetsp:Transcript_4094/g.12382  ORF Transcript_4094/g.12382 Transcript_4094/m.12382 type:complete len:216 (-) Transcript_4094:127-774(-)